MGVWHAAQWSFLTSAVAHSIWAARTRPQSQSSGRGNEANTRANSSSAIELEVAQLSKERVRHLPSIPGVVVQGHKWSLVLSTRENERTILWTEREFGTTQSMQDIFKIVAGLRELAAWCRDIYLPWWQQNVLEGFMGNDNVGTAME